MFNQLLCASMFFVALSIYAADERSVLQRVCRTIAMNGDLGVLERGAYVGLVTAAVLLSYEITDSDAPSDESGDYHVHCYGATLDLTNGGYGVCLDQQQPEVMSLDKAFCPIL